MVFVFLVITRNERFLPCKSNLDLRYICLIINLGSDVDNREWSFLDTDQIRLIVNISDNEGELQYLLDLVRSGELQ